LKSIILAKKFNFSAPKNLFSQRDFHDMQHINCQIRLNLDRNKFSFWL